MATMISDLDPELGTTVTIEAEVSGAFNKSDNEQEASPLTAFSNTMNLIGEIGAAVGRQVAGRLKGTGASVEAQFGIKIDTAGAVMVAMNLEVCQFIVTVKFDSKE